MQQAMDKINWFLRELVDKSGSELSFEPNKTPQVVTSNGPADLESPPLNGTKINMMVFSLIPEDVKQQLPNQSEVSFTHPHTLGSFDFKVKKSPGGFCVSVKPAGEGISGPPEDSPLNEMAPSAPEPIVQAEPVIETKPEPQSPSLPQSGKPVVENKPQQAQAPVAPKSPVQEPKAPAPTAVSTSNPPLSTEPVVSSAQPEASKDYSQTYSLQDQMEDILGSEEAAVEAVPEVEVAGFEVESTTPVDTPSPAAPAPPQPKQQTNFTPANPNASTGMDALFRKMSEVGASDLHLSVSVPPLVRKDGRMQPLTQGEAALTPDSIKELLTSIMPEKNRAEFEERNDTDFAYEIKGLARFRANVFMDRKGMGGVFRIIPSDIMTSEDLGLSKAIMNLTDLSKGLVVVTGPTGSGKSTTLCAMVDSINKNREDHIITIEDPIEFTHENIKCLVNQREVHNHTDSFKDALRAALREDPDILLVGEMRDLETISIAIETAETGHLVFGTLHTTTAASTVDRIIDQFPADRQQQVRVMLSESLKGVIAQTLLPKVGGGRIAALEVLIVTPAIANLIREGKTFQIPSQMQTGKNHGMIMLNDALMDLVNKGLVTPRDAYIKCIDKDGFETLLKRNGKSL